MTRIVIIGGGISGLVTAYSLSKSQLAQEGALEIHIYEASAKWGGVIQTEYENGFLMERGPDSFITAKPWALELCRQLGLESSLIETNPNVRQSFILSHGKLCPMPRGFYLMAPTKISEAFRTPLLSWKAKARIACEPFIPAKAREDDESLGSFVRRRFGKEMLERIAQPMIAGIYNADPEELSLKATFPHFLQMERKHGSVIRALTKQKDAAMTKASGPRYGLFLSLKEGVQSMISALINKTSNVHFHSMSKAHRLENNGGWKISFENGEYVEADSVCLALPAPAASRLLKSAADDLADQLSEISYGSVATVNLVFHRKDITHPLDGLGYVVPAIENKNIVGCTFSSIKFPGRAEDDGKVLVRAFLGGAFFRESLRWDDARIIESVCEELTHQIGVSAKPLTGLVSRWPEAIPQYRVGHLQTVERIFAALKDLPGLYLTGNAYCGTGIPDCIHHASQTADKILAGLERPVETVCADSR